MPKTTSVPLKIWDVCVWALVFFPLLGGGVWIMRPGLKLELTQLAIPTIIVTIWAGFLNSRGYCVQKTSAFRCIRHLWEWWEKKLRTKPKASLMMATFAVAFIYALASLRRHWAFSSGAADLGIFTNAIWNLTHGNGYISSVKDGMNLFADHQSPIFYLFAPLFIVWPKAETLLVMQALLLASGGLAVFGLARQYLGERHWALAAVPLCYWAYQPLRNANGFDFHPETSMLPIFLFFIWFAQRRENWARLTSILLLLLALGAKESAGPVAVGIGLAWICGAAPPSERQRLRWWSFPVIAMGLGVFLFDLKIVPSFFGGKDYVYMSAYGHLGNGLSDILLSPLLKPQVFWTHALFEKARLKFLFESFAPLAFVPLLAPSPLIASIPGFLMLFLEHDTHRITTGYHYIIEPGVGIFWAFAMGLSRFERANQQWASGLPALFSIKRWIPWSVATVLIFWSLAMHGRSEMYRIRFFQPTEHQRWVRRDVLPKIDPTATVSASGAFVPHLALRYWAHHLPKTHLPSGEPIGCIVREESVSNWPMQEDEWTSLQKILDREYALEYQCRTLRVYRHTGFLNGREKACAMNLPRCHD